MLDIEFGTFEANGEEIPLDYVSFEGDYEVDSNTEVRRNAFKKFSDALRRYENTTAATYNAHVQKEKLNLNYVVTTQLLIFIRITRCIKRNVRSSN